MTTTSRAAITEAREGIDRLLPLLADRRHADRLRRVRQELQALEDQGENGRVTIDPAHLEEMVEIVGYTCNSGKIDPAYHETAAETCVAMREIILQAE